ncbi:MAG: elongation factor G [Actinomycetota bacterium]
MKTYPTPNIRNVLLVGHGGAGKTSLVEAMAFTTGATNRMGRVEDGSSISDFEAEETKRHISVSLALVPLEWDGFKLNVLDAPGYADFLGDVTTAIRAADAMVFVVSAVEGVEVQTELIWKMAEDSGLPRAIFVTKMDRERASMSRTMEGLRAAFGKGVVPLYLPIGEESSFAGCVGLISGKAFRYPSGPRYEAGAVPVELTGDLDTLRGELIEAIIAESEDESLMERYLSGEDVPPEALIPDLEKAVAASGIFPVLCGAPTKGIGADLLCEFITNAFPSPEERPAVTGTAPGSDAEQTREPKDDGPLAAYVFKTISDPYVGRINLFRVVSGTLHPDATVFNASKGKDERLGTLFTLRGKTQDNVSSVPAGDIAAVAKLAETETGDTLTNKAKPFVLPRPVWPEPLLPVAIAPKSKGDEDKLSTAIHRMTSEDPTLRVGRNNDTHQTIMWAIGETHADITLERLKRKFGVEVMTVPLRVPYQETIKGKGKGLGRHVKQSGGHGQYGICNLEIEPLPRGGGYEFVDKIFGGSIPNQWIPSVDKGVRKAMEEGVVAGYPLVDVRVTLLDGKFHSVDSSDMAFQIAGSLGLRDAVQQAGACLLEPILDVEVLVPDSFVGDVLGDLSSRRGRVQGTQPAGAGRTVVSAKVPEAEVVRYAIDLRSMTGARGSFTRRFSHHEEVPGSLAEKVIAQAAKGKEAAH